MKYFLFFCWKLTFWLHLMLNMSECARKVAVRNWFWIMLQRHPRNNGSVLYSIYVATKWLLLRLRVWMVRIQILGRTTTALTEDFGGFPSFEASAGIARKPWSSWRRTNVFSQFLNRGFLDFTTNSLKRNVFVSSLKLPWNSTFKLIVS
jgi:hypothetical protein